MYVCEGEIPGEIVSAISKAHIGFVFSVPYVQLTVFILRHRIQNVCQDLQPQVGKMQVDHEVAKLAEVQKRRIRLQADVHSPRPQRPPLENPVEKKENGHTSREKNENSR